MKIFGIEILLAGHRSQVTGHSPISEADALAAFRVAADTPWFLAVRQTIDQVEAQMNEEARGFADAGEVNRCLNAVGAGKACEIIRARLVRLREQAVRGGSDK